MAIGRGIWVTGLSAAALAFSPGPGLAQAPDPVCSRAPGLPSVGPPERSADPWVWFAEPTSVYYWGDREDVNLGVGHLPLVEEEETPSGPTGYGWPPYIALPLWETPEGDFAGWIAWGKVFETGEPSVPLTGVGTVETEYEDQSIYVLEATAEGWLQIRLRVPTDSDDGLRWTHSCHLGLGDRTLRYESWKEVIRRHGEWLIFRSSSRHALREASEPGSTLAGWIGDDHEIELLQIVGDWARIRVREPAIACIGEIEEFTGTEREGWVRWFGADKGPWLWYYTRGC